MPMSAKYNKEGDFERVKETLFSSKNKDQLISAVKYINNFNKKYKITENSPEFVYFEKMVKLMRKKLRYKKPEVGNDLDEDSSMGFKLKNIIIESLLEFNVLHEEGVDDFKWVRDSESSFKPKFPFNGKEQWVDVSQLNSTEREKIVNYIKDVLPHFRDWEGNGLDQVVYGSHKGIIIHCGADVTDYKPSENLLCFTKDDYEEDYGNEGLDIDNSIYINGTEVIEYINMIDGEDLEESLDWDSKDTPFGEKDKSFDNDPTWIGDDEWETNPERSYWKQGNSGVGSGGSDVNESQDLDWIRDVSDRLPTYDQRTRVDLKDFLLDYAEDNLSVVDFLHGEDLYVHTEEYETRYTEEEWDEYGLDRWRDGDFKEHGHWVDDPWVTSWELIEELESGCNKWEFIDRTTNDYDLERGSYDDLFIFKRKKDRRYFALGVSGDSYDGMSDNADFLYEVFPQMKLVYESRKRLIKKILKEDELDWIRNVNPLAYGSYYVDVSNLDPNNRRKLQQTILDIGIRWAGERGDTIKSVYCNDPGVLAYVIEDNTLYTSYTPFQEYKGFSPETVILSVSMFMGLINRNLNESDEWEWMRDNSISGEELRELILDTGATSIPFVEVSGNLDLVGTQIKDLGNLQSVGGTLYLYETQIQSLGNLKTVVGDLYLVGTPIQSLGNLESVGGNLYLGGTQIQSLGNLESVGGNLYLGRTQIKDLGNLESVGGNLYLGRTQIKDLGNLQSVGGTLYLYETPIQSLGNLKTVGGFLNLERTPISKKYSEQEIRQMVQVNGNIYL